LIKPRHTPLTLTPLPRWGEGNKRIVLSHGGARGKMGEGEDEGGFKRLTTHDSRYFQGRPHQKKKEN